MVCRSTGKLNKVRLYIATKPEAAERRWRQWVCERGRGSRARGQKMKTSKGIKLRNILVNILTFGKQLVLLLVAGKVNVYFVFD